MILRDRDIGGAIVLRGFRCGSSFMQSGMAMSADQVRAIPAANRNALIEKKFIAVYPVGAEAKSEKLQRIIVSRGFAKFDVVEGRRLNAEPLTREQAEALAGGKERSKSARKMRRAA